MEDYIIGIGKRIREIRKEKGLTINTVAANAAVSNGLISRIENGRTIPSLPVLLNIINALETEVAAFFNSLPQSGKTAFIVSRKAENSIIEKEDDAKGFQYKSIFGKSLAFIAFEAVLLEIQPGSERAKVETDAYEFKYMLSGSCVYNIGEEEVTLHEGDAIFFDGRIPHVPINRSDTPTSMLVLYFYLKDAES
ncbi:helix-turn-helix domain-containing protein [Leeuwenhoekiella marinoflava]|uniref:XRE family transcriptional regulator n=2 Tax=Leeuwenhoekiella marinoflava TaxID=988 RepID=A0A4Q0PNN1_9FLAO|nr:helix-turn-helix domain-containing protein [Leeuwenhoekiella marinoflava]RXG29987.1 XRE family transcriptional regulator [Leeuwenhoekiella marinoflava]SHF24291.1 transcriptional regulator, XRE family with cupin sensor [Leeuwenhoekiella marinoflava DSM 3653]